MALINKKKRREKNLPLVKYAITNSSSKTKSPSRFFPPHSLNPTTLSGLNSDLIEVSSFTSEFCVLRGLSSSVLLVHISST